MGSTLMDYFNRAPRIGTLSTAGADGRVDVAVFGSPRMTDEKTVVLGSGTNRTLENLRENPHAVHMIMKPGAGIMDWKGVRVYMTRKGILESGPAFDEYRSMLARAVGEAAASVTHALVTFEVIGARPIVDMGQGWEQSV